MVSPSLSADPRDPIRLAKRILLFARVPAALALALSLVQSAPFLAGRDAALLGASATATSASWAVGTIIILLAAILPGAAILWQGPSRGIPLSLAGLGLYLVIGVITVGQLGVVLPVLAPAAAWYLSQVLGIGWRPHSAQNVRHFLPAGQRKVFISYRRRLDEVTARMLKQELVARGFDVFLDVDDLGPSARFDERLLEEIGGRFNFLILLSPGSLAGCQEPGDWVRLELEHALKTRRRVIPVTRAGFELGEGRDLPASIGSLPMHNAVAYSSTHHQAVLEHLVRFLCARAPAAA